MNLRVTRGSLSSAGSRTHQAEPMTVSGRRNECELPRKPGQKQARNRSEFVPSCPASQRLTQVALLSSYV